MGAALTGIDIVDKRRQPFGIAVKILYCYFHLHLILFPLNENGFRVDRGAFSV